MSEVSIAVLVALLDPRQVAEILNVPISWVYSAAERGELPSLKIGKYRRFRRSEIEAWLEEHRETK